MRIYVTEKHIFDGGNSQGSNPVALALREQLDRICSATSHNLWIKGCANEGRIPAPIEVTEWWNRWQDQGVCVAPFDFVLPDEVLATARPGTTLTESRKHV